MTAVADRPEASTGIRTPAERRRARNLGIAYLVLAGIVLWFFALGTEGDAVFRLGDRPGASGEREYALVAEADDLLELDAPFPVKLPIAEITP